MGMMKIKDIEKTIEDAKAAGFDVSVRDISYVILFFEYNNAAVSYKSIYGGVATDYDIDSYHNSPYIEFLRKYIKKNFKNSKDTGTSTEKMFADITFEENKDALISMLDEIQKGVNDGKIDYKDGLKLQADIRFKLKDKFEIEKKESMQYVIVEKKYNDVCPTCHHEIYIPTKEDLMEKYNLIEKQDKRNGKL